MYMHYGDHGAQDQSYLVIPPKEVVLAAAGSDPADASTYAPAHLVVLPPGLMDTCLFHLAPWLKRAREVVAAKVAKCKGGRKRAAERLFSACRSLHRPSVKCRTLHTGVLAAHRRKERSLQLSCC